MFSLAAFRGPAAPLPLPAAPAPQVFGGFAPAGPPADGGHAFGHAWAPGWLKHHPPAPAVNVIEGQAGPDFLRGTAGPDRFVIDNDVQGFTQIDGFQPGVDKLDLSRLPGVDDLSDLRSLSTGPVVPIGDPVYPTTIAVGDFHPDTQRWDQFITINATQPFQTSDIIW